MIIVNRWLRTSAGSQWHWHSTKLAAWEVADSTSMSWLSGSGREYVRGMRLPTMVCRWALLRKRGGTKGRIHGEASVVSNRPSSVVPIRVPDFHLRILLTIRASGMDCCWRGKHRTFGCGELPPAHNSSQNSCNCAVDRVYKLAVS